jgi:hypothetical protein
MYLSCWKGLKSPDLNQYPTMLRAFDGRGFHPHGILQSLAIQLGGKTVSVDVEVVYAPLDYNLLLGRICFMLWMSLLLRCFDVSNFSIKVKL